MSIIHESTEDLATQDFTTVIHQLELLDRQLRSSPRWRVPEVWAACDALACAAALLRTQQSSPVGPAGDATLLQDAIALARSTVEATKFAARERIGTRFQNVGERI
ncbi:hypothetical protein ACIA8C_23170 [Nocardia sp. NPDC051321]|uniref:hypothetical protein n=1 Tax=Nocardia sp. NPDC051321 TaxID=3364323 RepID=UPI003798BC6F